MSDNLLPFDFGEVLSTELTRGNRANDHLAHPSSHLIGSLRHAALDVAGAPQEERPVIDQIVLHTGTMWHEWIARTMSGLGMPIMQEVNVTPWLPTGWAGTLDALVWSPDDKGFVLCDYKTIRGSGLQYIARQGAKVEHQAQASAYWHAAVKMGLPMVKRICIIYLPKDAAGKGLVEPLQVQFEPMPKGPLHKDMEGRWGTISSYVTSLGGTPGQPVEVKSLSGWVTDALPPTQEREQKLVYDKVTGMSDLLLVPHWSAAYCRFPVELCDCSTQGQTKIGFFDMTGEYVPREGYEKIKPTIHPY
jgi:hypothetical protein